MTVRLETERKSALNGQAAVPALDLEAVYFDTAGLRLARWGLTLRRRHGGHDAGWHLKVPTRKDIRQEIHRPLGTEQPPEELVTLLAGVTRGSPLVPVRALRVGSDVPKLGRKADAGQTVMAYLHQQVAVLLRHDVLVRAGADDAVHQMRVAARRIRTALRVFGKIIDRDRTRTLDNELHGLIERLGSARDLEVLEERFRDGVSELPDTLVIGPIQTGLTRHFAPAQQDAERGVRRALDGRRHAKLVESLEQLLDRPPLTQRAAKQARTELPKQISKTYRRLAGRLRDARRSPPGSAHDIALHRMRKAARRLRYALEVVQPVIGREAKRTRVRTKALTSLLGEHQDSVVARPVLRKLASATHVAGANGFTFGLLYGAEVGRAELIESTLTSHWKLLRKRTSWLG